MSVSENHKTARLRIGRVLLASCAAAGLLLGQDSAPAPDQKRNLQVLRSMELRAETGDPASQYLLALMYRSGLQGVEPDLLEARRWLLEAANQGYTKAQFTLGAMFANGEGLEADYLQAYVWFTIAAWGSEGREQATYMAAREKVRGQLTPEQLDEARRRARDWSADSNSPGDLPEDESEEK